MKALEKDRNRRYETASAFAADVRRVLDRRAGGGLAAVGAVPFRQVGASESRGADDGGAGSRRPARGDGGERLPRGRGLAAEGKAQDATADALKAKAGSDENARLANERKTQVEILAKGFQQALYDADLELMPATWEADDLAAFDQLLERQVNGKQVGDPRGFEWYYWNRQRHGELRSVALPGGLHEIWAPTFSPDGKLIAGIVRVEDGGEVRLWDAATRRGAADAADPPRLRPRLAFQAGPDRVQPGRPPRGAGPNILRPVCGSEGGG